MSAAASLAIGYLPKRGVTRVEFLALTIESLVILGQGHEALLTERILHGASLPLFLVVRRFVEMEKKRPWIPEGQDWK